MSQEKIDKYKQEKYNRKNAPKKSHFKKYIAYAATTVIAAAFLIYVGYSVGIETGLIKQKETTSAYVGTITKDELESKLQSYDPIGMYTKYAGKDKTEDSDVSVEEATTAEDAATEEAATEEAATEEDSTK
ncbi:MAG: hypothetical protein K6G88_05915 [Lachnospiraceae bacterium]|nr:hypothetical protein [Lachnospiraceae bacterium]